MEKGSSVRKSDYEIERIFLDRWSPRAMSGEEISDEELMRMFEAARWAPSSFNEQPWRFIYGKKGSESFDKLFDLLVEGNKSWNEKAGVLVCILSKKTFTQNGKPHASAQFSTGSAFENLALQGASMGLVVHGMGGFDREKAREVLKVPEDYDVLVMFSIGRPGDKETLVESLKEVEKPSGRKKVEEFAFDGEFRG